MDRRRACLPSRQIYRITPKYPEARPSAGVVPSRIAQVGPQEPPAPSLRCAQKGAPLRGVSLLWTTWTIRGAEAQHSHLTTLQQMATGLQWHRQQDFRQPENEQKKVQEAAEEDDPQERRLQRITLAERQ